CFLILFVILFFEGIFSYLGYQNFQTLKMTETIQYSFYMLYFFGDIEGYFFFQERTKAYDI
ncbi:hypothetical protein, partial [Streptococcus agalactiae]